jgi:hypothetical protein
MYPAESSASFLLRILESICINCTKGSAYLENARDRENDCSHRAVVTYIYRLLPHIYIIHWRGGGKSMYFRAVDIFSVFLKVFTTEGGLFVLSHSLG